MGLLTWAFRHGFFDLSIFDCGLEFFVGTAEVAAGGLDAGVPQQVADLFDGDAFAFAPLGEGVSQPVWSKVWDADLSPEVRDDALHGTRGHSE